MVINFDTSALPRGVVGWHALLDAIKAAHPSDENQWIEFKANVDPSTKDGRATIAKGIVAFANRDIQTSQQWLGGYALIVIGLAPGNVVGTPVIDPADLYNKVNALLAPPAPGWDATPIEFEGKHILIITVDPPRQGDAIAAIGKSSGEVEDGHVYVRKLGVSDRAKASDIRRLSARLHSTDRSIGGITIRAAEGSQIPIIEYPETWMDDWLEEEKRLLLAPLDPPPPRSMTVAERRAADLMGGALSSFARSGEPSRTIGAAFGGTRQEENRTKAKFTEEVGAYLNRCQSGLADAFERLRQSASFEVLLEVANETDVNYEEVLVELHIEGDDVYGYGYGGNVRKLRSYLPSPPRAWGPWTKPRFQPEVRYTAQALEQKSTARAVYGAVPIPSIINGSPADVECQPLHLRPRRTTDLMHLWLVGDGGPFGDDVRVTWTATAKNVDGKLEGEFLIPVAPSAMYVGTWLEHRKP